MSTPTNDFQNLNIGGMPETRSQSRRDQQGGGRTRASRGRGRGGRTPQASSRSNTSIHGHSGLLYNTQNLSPGSASRAAEGLLSEFFVDRLQRHESSRGTYYAFQLKKPVSVRIHDPEVNDNKVECTCEDYQTTNTACVHIYWLFDGLRAVLVDDSNAATHTVTQGEVVAQISGLYDLIGKRLGSLPEQLNTTRGDTRGDDTDSDPDDSTTEESYASSNSDARKEIVRDMLSVFDYKALPSEYGRDFAGDIPPTTAGEDLFVRGSLAATVYGIAIRDETFYRRLRKVISRNICAGIYFSKQRQRAQNIMLKLDQHTQTKAPEIPESRIVNVRECARTLRLIVDQICESRDSRASREPLGAGVISKVAEILVEILHEVVCNRNKNVYENNTEKRGDKEHERDRNLYTYLIGNPPRFDESYPLGMRNLFIIDRLHDFPTDEWSHLLERLTTIADQIRENTPDDQHSSNPYLARLNDLIREYNDDHFEPSLSSYGHRRPTVDSPRDSQRRRVD